MKTNNCILYKSSNVAHVSLQATRMEASFSAMTTAGMCLLQIFVHAIVTIFKYTTYEHKAI